MTNTADMELMRDFVSRSSDRAFAALVSRHADLVYSCALRQARDPHLAEEITQAVFLLLARKATSLGAGTILPAWLCRTTRHVVANALRTQARRRQREQEAYMRSIFENSPNAVWTRISPLLDAAMAELPRKEHDALVLRFFEGRNFGEVGVALGISGDAAKMRVSRALEKLRGYFGRHGVALGVGAIAAAMSADSVHAAPAALKVSLAAAAIKGGTVSPSVAALAAGAIGQMTLSKFHIAAVAAAVAVLAVLLPTVVHPKKSTAASGALSRSPKPVAGAWGNSSAADDRRPFPVRVVDEKGEPIPNATIEFPDGWIMLRNKAGNEFRGALLMDIDVWQIWKTDEAGNAILRLPPKVFSFTELPFMDALVRAPGFRGYYARLPLEGPAVAVLPGGPRLTAHVTDAATGRVVSRPYLCVARINELLLPQLEYLDFSTWQRKAEGELSAVMPEGKYVVAAVDLSGPLPRYSKPRIVKLAGLGESRVELQTEAGIHTRGRLAANVPRPVEGGRVMACVISVVDPHPAAISEWVVSADIAEDGTFDLGHLPAGKLRLIAMCDGYTSIPTNAKDIGSGPAQDFPQGTVMPVEVQMEEGGNLKVLVRDEAGRPVAGADVTVGVAQRFDSYHAYYGDTKPDLVARQNEPADIIPKIDMDTFVTTTDAGGVAKLTGLPPGERVFRVSREGSEKVVGKVTVRSREWAGAEVALKPGDGIALD